jgi:hypothetical protein
MKRLLAFCLTLGMAGAAKGDEQSTSPYATAADFAKYAMKLREQALLKVEPQVFVPTSSRPITPRYPWKLNIVTTMFWVGEEAGGNNPVPNYRSSWDLNWSTNYGGTDNPDPSARRGYIPVAFIPHQNPFYCALPYNDVTHGQFKPEAPLVIPWFKQAYAGAGQSVCRHRWVAIRKGNRTCYAQWEDCGPFRTDHFQYVFGNERPRPNLNHGAGLDVSPAVRDYLGLAPTDVTDWQFVDVRDVPPGPWRNYGENNNFVIARRQTQRAVAEQFAGAATPLVSSSLPPSERDLTSEVSAGSMLSLTDVNMTEIRDPDAEKNLTLRIAIKKQTNAAIDPNKVRILVKFYDTLNDKEVKLTDAAVNYEWLRATRDWTGANPEILSVNYLRPTL